MYIAAPSTQNGKQISLLQRQSYESFNILEQIYMD